MNSFVARLSQFPHGPLPWISLGLTLRVCAVQSALMQPAPIRNKALFWIVCLSAFLLLGIAVVRLSA